MNVKSFEHACEIKKITPESVIPFPKPLTPSHEALNAIAMLWEIIEVQNEGWKPDYSNRNEYKWYPYFNLFSGFVFAYSDFAWAGTPANGGSRFAIKSEQDSDYIGTTFSDLYKKVLTIMPIQQ